MKIFSRPPRPEVPKVSHERLYVSFVRSGIYDPELGILTPDGRDQTKLAAQVIRDEAGRDQVVVFRDHRFGIDFGPYGETANIIASILATRTYDSPCKYEPDNADIHKMSDMYLLKGVNRFVRVIKGRHLGAMLRAYPGPEVPLSDMGPAHGSVHTLRIGLDIYGDIADKRFV